MRKSIIITILALIIFHGVSFSQDAETKKIEEYYEEYNYYKYIEKFENIENRTAEANRKLAESYFYTGDYKKCEEIYADLVVSQEKTNEDVYNYAYILAMNEKYEDASKWMETYNRINKSDSRGQNYVSQSKLLKKLLVDKEQFKVKSLNINSKHADFGIAYFKDKIVFVSTREKVKPVRRRWNWNKLPFLSMYIATPDKSNELTELKEFNITSNIKFHEGPVTFNKSGTYAVFTRNNYKQKSSAGVTKLQLIGIENKEGRWVNEKVLTFNSKEYSCAQACLSADGKTLYFVSDMPGGKGENDIYITKMTDSGTWATPENISSINTEGDEMFPFIHESGRFFYSSDGRFGLGGLDIFMADVKNGNIENVTNLGVPVNSSHDDFSFVLDSVMQFGYFASNRAGGKGNDDIYSYKLLKPFIEEKLIAGVTKDMSENIITDAKVTIYDDKDNILETLISDENGKFNFTAEVDKTYKFISEKETYLNGNSQVTTSGEEKTFNTELIMDTDKGLSIYCLVTEKGTGTKLADVDITVIDNSNWQKYKVKTSELGEYIEELTTYKVNDSVSFDFKFEKEGYIGTKVDFNKKLDRKGQYKLLGKLAAVELEKIDVGTDLATDITFNAIYFDYEKYNIRKDAGQELDKIVKIMNDNPKMEVELASHTDCRGADIYNLKLSDRRAKATANYIKKRITKPTRIKGKGYGETKLKVKCNCDKKASDACTEEQHLQNRRTEFIITKMK